MPQVTHELTFSLTVEIRKLRLQLLAEQRMVIRREKEVNKLLMELNRRPKYVPDIEEERKICEECVNLHEPTVRSSQTVGGAFKDPACADAKDQAADSGEPGQDGQASQ
jgi:hypothetical protein